MSKLLRDSKLFSTGGGTAILKGYLDMYGGVICGHSDGGMGTTGIPQVGARDAIHPSLLRAIE